MSESNPMAGSNSSFLTGRYSAEKRFKFYGVFAVSLALGAVILLLFTIYLFSRSNAFGHALVGT